MTTVINSEQFKKIIKEKQTFVIKFFTEGCPNCLMMKDQYERASKTAIIDFFKIKGELEIDDLTEFSVLAFPTTLVFIEGQERARFGGFMNLSQINEFYLAALNNNQKILARMRDIEKISIQCGTISMIEVKNNKLYISFWDGSIREYSDIDPKHVKTILDINGKSSVGSYYRKNIRPNYEFVEIKNATKKIEGFENKK